MFESLITTTLWTLSTWTLILLISDFLRTNFNRTVSIHEFFCWMNSFLSNIDPPRASGTTGGYDLRTDNEGEPARGVPRWSFSSPERPANLPQPSRVANGRHASRSSTNPIFSHPGAARPALHLRVLLLRAGDVESNPGPRCSRCDMMINLNSTSSQSPSSLPQIQNRYTRLTRARQMSPQSFVCINCENGVETQDDPVTLPIPLNPAPPTYSNQTCPTCRKKLQKATRPLRCCSCNERHHVGCATEPRSLLELQYHLYLSLFVLCAKPFFLLLLSRRLCLRSVQTKVLDPTASTLVFSRCFPAISQHRWRAFSISRLPTALSLMTGGRRLSTQFSKKVVKRGLKTIVPSQ